MVAQPKGGRAQIVEGLRRGLLPFAPGAAVQPPNSPRTRPLEEGCTSYGRRSSVRAGPALAASGGAAPRGRTAWAEPHANGGLLYSGPSCGLREDGVSVTGPELTQRAPRVPAACARRAEGDADGELPDFGPAETASNASVRSSKHRRDLEATPGGRRPPGQRWPRHGGLERGPCEVLGYMRPASRAVQLLGGVHSQRRPMSPARKWMKVCRGSGACLCRR